MAGRPVYHPIFLIASPRLDVRTLAGYSASQRAQLDDCTTQQKVNAACALNRFWLWEWHEENCVSSSALCGQNEKFLNVTGDTYTIEL